MPPLETILPYNHESSKLFVNAFKTAALIIWMKEGSEIFLDCLLSKDAESKIIYETSAGLVYLDFSKASLRKSRKIFRL